MVLGSVAGVSVLQFPPPPLVSARPGLPGGVVSFFVLSSVVALVCCRRPLMEVTFDVIFLISGFGAFGRTSAVLIEERYCSLWKSDNLDDYSDAPMVTTKTGAIMRL